jgi:hypothetical protein
VMPGKDSAIPPGSSHRLQFEGRLVPYATSCSFRHRSYNDCSAARSLLRGRGYRGRSVISSDNLSNKHSKSQRYKRMGRAPSHLLRSCRFDPADLQIFLLRSAKFSSVSRS